MKNVKWFVLGLILLFIEIEVFSQKKNLAISFSTGYFRDTISVLLNSDSVLLKEVITTKPSLGFAHYLEVQYPRSENINLIIIINGRVLGRMGFEILKNKSIIEISYVRNE